MAKVYNTYIQKGNTPLLIDYLHLDFYKKLIFNNFLKTLSNC